MASYVKRSRRLGSGKEIEDPEPRKQVKMRFDRFTQRAQEAIARSQEILVRYQHSQMDLEHVLLALLEQPEGAVQDIFELLGTDIEAMKRRVDQILQAQPK